MTAAKRQTPEKRPYSVLEAATCYCKPGACDCIDARVRAAELTAMFNLRWDADMRAIKRWQAAAPGRELTWPDHADMVVWLLDQLPEDPPQKRDMSKVECDDNCGALVEPVTPTEIRAAYEHWAEHGCMAGCSHAR